MTPLKGHPHRTVRVEHRRLPPRVYQLYGGPNEADEIRLIANQLGNVPPEATASFEDMFHFLGRMRCRLMKVANRMDAPAPINAPIRRAPLSAEEKAQAQLDLILC